MKRFPRFRRIVCLGIVLIVGLVVVLAALVQIQQRLLRYRAERLLSDIRKLELRKSDWADAKQILARWGAWGHYEGQCTEESCIYQIGLSDWLTSFAYRHPSSLEHFHWLETPYGMLGGRGTIIRAELQVTKGVVWGKSFSIYVYVPAETGPAALFRGKGYTLIGVSQSVSRFPSDRPLIPTHPNYSVGTPGGCTGCLAVYSEFTPYADPADVERLMDFNLSCLTRWTRCRGKGDVMPAAWRQYTAEESSREAAWEQVEQCKTPLEVMGRDTANAVVVDVVASRTVDASGEPLQLSDVRLVQRLKGASFWEPNTIQTVQLWDTQVSRTSHNKAKDVSPGHPFILLFSHQSWQRVSVDRCGAIPYTEQNLSLVQRGIDQDYLSRLR